jgi:tetratricopeptide (TPR) repeat protein
MRRVELAKRLMAAGNNHERTSLLDQNQHLADSRLADEIRRSCYAVWASEPIKARNAEKAMSSLTEFDLSPATAAISHWVSGIAAITNGKFESAVDALTRAAEAFSTLGRKIDTAQTQVAKLLALGMLGRYDEAVNTGRQALVQFVKAGDNLAAGKIEMNLSNVVARREHHRDAEAYALSARRRFIKAGERRWQTMAENDLANTYTELNEFAKARHFYSLALEGARAEKMHVTEAEIEASLGNLAELQGKYADALRYLESSRQKYEQLAMPHQSAIADMEIADIYLELNLAAEAGAIYERVSKTFARLKLTAEEARTHLNHGRAAINSKQLAKGKSELSKALKLFEKERNGAGQASSLLALARLAIAEGSSDAPAAVHRAAAAVRSSENPRHQLYLSLLKGESARRSGKYKLSERHYNEALLLAKKVRQPTLAEFAFNALGKVAADQGDLKRAAANYKRAIRIIEELRSPLDADFSMAFFAARIEPYENLSKLLLEKGRVAEAFKVTEAGKSRSLLDSMHAEVSRNGHPSPLQDRLNELRSELNALYKRLDTAGATDAEALRTTAAGVEKQIAATTRQIKSLGHNDKRGSGFSSLSVAGLQRELGAGTTLIEFVEMDGAFGAFVIDSEKITYVRGLGKVEDIKRALHDLRFQFGSLRYGADVLRKFGAQLKQRTDASLGSLYDLVLRPLERHMKGKRLVIVPDGLLYYVPFSSLHDGGRYLAESFETSFSPSAAIWHALNQKSGRKAKNSLLVGYADERIPLVENEIRAIAGILPEPTEIIAEGATYDAVINELPRHDLLHIACHGQFRSDNPMFSSLHLADGWITVRDVVSQRLKAKLVTLSACETGLNELFAGDEILGLARGFLAAGAEDLIVSLWTVNDSATAVLMQAFYQNLQRGLSISASLRQAQIGFIERGEHPYLWSPFILIGR